MISLEGPEIRFRVSDGQDLFDFWQKYPIILGQERDGPFVGPSKLDAGFAREIKRHRHALRTKAKRAEEEGGNAPKVKNEHDENDVLFFTANFPRAVCNVLEEF